jgi:feruloyl-CoA synthase
MAKPEVVVERRPDGCLVLRSPQASPGHARAVGEWLQHWGTTTPERLFLAERAGDDWRRVTYGEALARIRTLGQGLLDHGLDAGKPVAILSDNSIDHALLALAAMHVGVPVAPVSPAYSLMSKDHLKLRHIVDVLQPGLVWTADPARFAPALAAIGLRATPLDELSGRAPTDAVDRAFAALAPDTVAKILFTSGSTGMPKGVINTQRMLTANQEMALQAWQFLADKPPVIVDWLPWNHTFGGNYNFNMVLRNGGALYIDGGKPMPGLVETTVRNLREIRPTAYFNVPRGFDLLMPFLENDADLRRNFFAGVEFVFYAGAALPQNLWERFETLALAERGGELALVSAWGSTETAPLATAVHYAVERAGIIGLPVPGCEIKLVPTADKLEARVRGPGVTPGYFKRPDLTAAAFDEEGFYRIGDALRFADPADPSRGLMFDGRVAEDFKLSTGTWVSVGSTRVRLIAAADPLIQDAVITGHDRDQVGALVFLNPAAARDLSPQALRSRLAEALERMAADTGAGSSSHPRRLLVLAEPPQIDAHEITDKGYLNQRAVLEHRAAQVEALYATPTRPEVIVGG